MTRSLRFLLLLAAAGMFVSSQEALAATFTSAASGNWNSPATWSVAGFDADGIPDADDTVNIAAGHTVTLNVSGACAALNFLNTAGNATLQHNAGMALAVGGSATLNGATGGSSTKAWSIGAGSATVGGNVTLNGGSNNSRIARINLTSGTLTIAGGLTYNAGNAVRAVIDMSGGAATLNLAGALTVNNGTLTPGASSVFNYNGAAAQTVVVGASSIVYRNLHLNNTSGATLSAAITAANVTGNVRVQSGVLNNGGFAIAGGAGDTFEVASGARFNLTGNTVMASGFSSKTFGPASTVNYARSGGTQAVSAESYGHLILSAGGTKQMAAGTTAIAGDFTLAAATTYNGATNNPTVNLAGNFTNSGTFNSGTGQFTFNGTGGQSLSGATTFTSLRMNSSGSGLAIANDVTVGNQLTFTSGNIATGTNTLITTQSCTLPSVVRSSGHVIGNLRKHIPFRLFTPVICTFEVGDSAAYAPVALTLTLVFAAGDLTVSTTPGDHPAIGASGIDPAKSVNRYWTLTNAGVGFWSCDAVFNFVAGDVDPGATPAVFETTRYVAPNWFATTPGTRTATSIQVTGLTAFGDFAVGEIATPPPTLGGFNAYESTTPPGAIAGVIKTKVAGSAISLDIIVLNFSRTGIWSTFTGTVKVELLNTADNSGPVDGNGCRSTWSTIQTLSPNPTFVTADQGRKTISFAENNSWPDARLRISFPATGVPFLIGCSTNNFAIRPASLSVSASDLDWQAAGTSRTLNNAGATGGNVHKAGQPFTLRAVAAPASATNYAGNPTVKTLACTLPSPCANGTLMPGAWSGSGTRTANGASYSEAGTVNLELEDQTFANVDSADSTLAERTVPQSPAPLAVGRFVPDHFAVATDSIPQFKTFDDTACSSRSFTYIGQPFGYATLPQVRITAQNAANGTTTNYSQNLWKLTAADVAQNYASTPSLDTALIGAPTMASNNNGTGTAAADSADKLAYARNLAAPQVPFNADISLTVSVSDATESATVGNGTIATASPAVFNGSGSGIEFDAGNAFRYGRLWIPNAHGSELLALPVGMETQYWNGTGFVTHSADNCTQIAAANLVLSNYQKNLQAGETGISISGRFTAGKSNLTLAKPSGGDGLYNGSLDLCVDLDAGAGGDTACQAATPAGKSYLQGRWSGSNYDKDPKARATFGLYRRANEFIYFREAY